MNEELSGEELAIDLIPAVEQQIDSAATPFVKVTFERLLSEEEEELEAKKLIALCLADEVELMKKEGRQFDLQRYQGLLEFLPVLPE